MRLSAPQFAVLEAIARRTTIKQIARDMGVSESAINKRIRALKTELRANSLTDLAQAYDEISATKGQIGYRKAACRKNHLPEVNGSDDSSNPDSVEPVITFHDTVSYRQPTPWETIQPISVVPGVLNGVNGKWNRGILIILLTIGLFATILVGLGAANGLSSALAERRSNPAASN